MTLNPEEQNILGKINSHQIRAGSEQELREAADNTWLYPFFFFLSNSSEEYYDPPSRDTPSYEQRERITVQQEEFVTGEGLSSSPAPDSQMSQEELSSSIYQDSYSLSEGVGSPQPHNVRICHYINRCPLSSSSLWMPPAKKIAKSAPEVARHPNCVQNFQQNFSLHNNKRRNSDGKTKTRGCLGAQIQIAWSTVP